MQLLRLGQEVLIVISSLALLLFIFAIYERFRLAAGLELLSDRFIAYLENIHQRTARKDADEPEIRDYQLSGKIIIKNICFKENEKQ